MNDIQRDIKRMEPWFHNLHLPGGIQTAPDHPLGDFPQFKWNDIAHLIPYNLEGYHALDIGCNAGFYSFKMALRGASVTGIDIDDHYLMQARWASKQFELDNKINFVKMQIYDLSRTHHMYDLVWFMGVFYHLRYPLLALDIVSRVCNDLMVFQTMTIPNSHTPIHRNNIALLDREILNNYGWPKMAFIEHCIDDDPTNWWVPDHGAVMAMLRTVGFEIISQPSHEIYICKKIDELHDPADLRELEFLAATGSGKKH